MQVTQLNMSDSMERVLFSFLGLPDHTFPPLSCHKPVVLSTRSYQVAGIGGIERRAHWGVIFIYLTGKKSFLKFRKAHLQELF